MNLDDGKIHSNLISSIINKQTLNYFLTANQRSFCYISDAIRAILTILFEAKSGFTYNIANPKESVRLSTYVKIF